MNLTQEIILALMVATGWPIYACMVLMQILATFVVVIILVLLKAPAIAYKLVVALAFFGMGLAIVATLGGWFLFIVECLTGVILLAIIKGVSATHPKVDAHSLDKDGRSILVHAGQPYIGPGRYSPKIKDVGEAAGKLASQIAGYPERDDDVPDREIKYGTNGTKGQ